MNNTNPLIVGGEYMHYKGNLYVIVAKATLENTMEEAVIYYSMKNTERLWIRSVTNFFEDVEGKARFQFTGNTKEISFSVKD